MDPPAGTILTGKLTPRFDPSIYQITRFGWFRAFGQDPSIAAPPVLTDFLTVNPAWASTWHLQASNSRLISNVSLDNAQGRMVVTFDWGAKGYTAATNDDFNFFGYQFTLPASMTNAQLQQASTGPFGPGK
jgi:hypothetical protein